MCYISEDVMESARKLVTDDLGMDYGVLQSSYIDIIAEAFMDERNRCRWLSIETAPKDGTVIDLWGVHRLQLILPGWRVPNAMWGRVYDFNGGSTDGWVHGEIDAFTPTHWMPLPKPPEA